MEPLVQSVFYKKK